MPVGFTLVLVHLAVVFLFLLGFLWFSSRRIIRVLEEGKSGFWKRLTLRAALLPVRFFGNLFQRERGAKLPFALRWFNAFTRFCSRIPYFHFLPKFIIATTTELSIEVFTGNKILTAVMFLWSFSFFLVVTIVESRLGELEEDAITLANAIFLRMSVIITLIMLLIGKVFWKSFEPFFENGFWHAISVVSGFSNGLLIKGWIGFWNLHPGIIILVISIIGVYIASSLAEKK